jgi:hypothetical protein
MRQLHVVEAEGRRIRVERHGIDAEKRRKVREAAVRAGERLGPADDARLHLEVGVRRHQVLDGVQPFVPHGGEVRVLIIAVRRIEQHHIRCPRQLGERGRNERAIARVVGERAAGIELRRDIVARQVRGEIAERQPGQRTEDAERLDQRHRHVLPPEQLEQVVHERRVQRPHLVETARLPHALDDLGVEVADVDVLQPSLLPLHA